jgi:hypothetical protein
MKIRATLIAVTMATAGLLAAASARADVCVECHQKVTPGVVADFKLSKMATDGGVTCSTCHGDKHQSDKDVAAVKLPTPATCAPCHQDRVDEYSKGKHAAAWPAMNAMPATHNQPMAQIDGMKGCGGCHKVGIKSEADIKKLKAEGSVFGHAACDSCHTRHTFSVAEAKSPQACQTCHMGFDHPNYEMYISSKHGVREDLKQRKLIPETSSAPTCQTCHMQGGNHEVRTAWGFLAVRLPLPEDPQWKADQITILQALGVLDPDGKPTARLEIVKGAQVARLTQEEFDKERNKMLATCGQCHSENFAKGEMAMGDKMIQEADRLMAEAIRIIAGLYKDGIIPKPATYAYPFPDLLTFHEAPTTIEQKLFVMFLEHRMRTWQGAFHMNPDYSHWYGWHEMVNDLAEIKEKAAELRHAKK